MQEIVEAFAAIRRPRLLIRAAEAGLAARKPGNGPHRAPSLHALFEAEERLETRRRAGDAGYRAASHVAAMIALMAEVMALRPQHPA